MKDFIKNNIHKIISIRTCNGLDHNFLNIMIVAYNKIDKKDWAFLSNWLSNCQK